tara:strand:- start:283 stop:723 length:441 start_codon:yes stop_codon:yes gene_type:complete
MYRPLPKCLTIKNSPIEGLGLYATKNIKANTFIGLTHIRDEEFENKYIRTPLGGFYNHSNNPNVIKIVSNSIPKLKCGDSIDQKVEMQKLTDGNANRENLYPSLDPKAEAKYMFLISIRDIKVGEEITANYNLYTYPKTGIGIQGL